MRTKLLLPLILFNILFNTISYAQWSAPTNISPGTTTVGTNENAGQCICVAGDTLRIIYSDQSTVPVKIMFNQSPDKGITWGIPMQLYSSPNCGFTAIANTGSNVHVVWLDSLGSDRASFYKRSLDGGITWGQTICLDSVTKFWPGIACSGNLVIATLNKDLSGNTEVFVKRSIDNGTSWLPEQQISNAPNRSEDPAINISGNDVHLSWNDKRSGTMNIYYCHSSDGGVTWNTDTPLTSADSYTSMVCLDGNHVDVPHGIRTGTTFNAWNSESANTGFNWMADQQLTDTSNGGGIYPFMVRDSMQMNLVYLGNGGTYFLHSDNGGITWDNPLFLSASGQPFIAYTGCVLHVIFSNGGHINYMRNPTGNGNCSTSDIGQVNVNSVDVEIFPNPFPNQATIRFSEVQENSTITLYDAIGREIKSINFCGKQFILDNEEMSSGIYFLKITNNGKIVFIRKIILQ